MAKNFKAHNPPREPKGRDGYYTKPSSAGRSESYGSDKPVCSEKTPSIEKAYGEKYGDQADD